jgi:hypothetical protein
MSEKQSNEIPEVRVISKESVKLQQKKAREASVNARAALHRLQGVVDKGHTSAVIHLDKDTQEEALAILHRHGYKTEDVGDHPVLYNERNFRIWALPPETD